MKIKLTVYTYFQKYTWEPEGKYVVYSLKINSDAMNTFICEQEVEIEIPDNFDVTQEQVANLIKRKDKLNEEHMKAIATIDDQLNSVKSGVTNV
jgi:hypothetical protein